MKRLLSLLAAVLLLGVCLLPVTALASTEYGLAYDVTDSMDSEFMNALGQDTFYRLTQASGIEVRVDIVDDLEGYSISEYAEIFYEKYEYGYGEDGSCVLLMILVSRDDTGLALEDYMVYLGGSASDVITPAVGQELTDALDAWFTPELWGDGLATDVMACESGLEEYARFLNDYLADGTVAVPQPVNTEDPERLTPWENIGEGETSAVQSLTDGAPGYIPAGTYVADLAGILTTDEAAELNRMAAEASAKYDAGIYIVTVQDFTDYNSESAYEAAKTIYLDNGFGLGDDQSGTMLLLSMADRDYGYIAYGDFGNYAFTDYGKDQLKNEFLDNFRNNDWFGGFRDFITESDYYMAQAKADTPIDYVEEPFNTGAALAGSVGLGALASGAGSAIRCNGLKKKMKTVYTKADATQYMAAAGLAGIVMRASTDQFIDTTVTRVPIHVDNDNDHRGGWSGGTTIDAGGFSGHSGKF